MKTVLAYSGGLDTSVMLKWMADKGYEVTCYMADVGQGEDFSRAKEKALSLGAKDVVVEDLKEEFVTGFIWKALMANAMYEGRYLLGTSLARPLIAKGQVQCARKVGAKLLSHGATGKGNDQVRFELAYKSLDPGLEVFAPWRDGDFISRFKGRSDMIAYAMENEIPTTSTKEKPFSMDRNLMHASYEGGMLEDPSFAPSKDMHCMVLPKEQAPDRVTTIEIEFRGGVPYIVDHIIKDKYPKATDCFGGPVLIMDVLNELGGKNGIGRIDMVENRIIGIKSRGIYESPGATILWKAHRDLESLVLDKEVIHQKDLIMPKIADLIYKGLWFSKEMEMLMSMVEKTQTEVEGTVKLELYKGNADVVSRTSKRSRYNGTLSSMDSLEGFNPGDAGGYIKILSLRL